MIHVVPSFTELSDTEKMPFILGEDDNTAALAAQFSLPLQTRLFFKRVIYFFQAKRFSLLVCTFQKVVMYF